MNDGSHRSYRLGPSSRPTASIGLMLMVVGLMCLRVVGSAGPAPLAQAAAAQQSTREEPMPRAGIDPNGVITGHAVRLPNTEVATLRIRFDAGARTIWHTHVGPQVILVQEGVGRFQQKGGPIVELRPGQAFYAPPNIPHWHGAAPDAAVTMLSLYPIGSKLTPGAEVTETEYLGKAQTNRP